MNHRKQNNKEPKPHKEKGKITEVISLDVGEEGEEPADLSVETTRDLLEDAEEELYSEEIARYTDSKEIQETLENRQDLNVGKAELVEKLQSHHAKSPELSGGDIDAAWDDADVGEETVGGMNPTPDQDMVEEIGAALGITYEDDEPLQTGEKLTKRDEERWELDPESAEETT
jgi:hypothetical protein